ncbi:hypothetical protein EBT31_09830 [bacterium]|jgi:hypothetical protein|nr:hypothetical protein [bacterium]
MVEPYFSQVYSTGPVPDLRTRHRLFVDNRDRDTDVYPNPFQFTLHFDTCGVPSYNNVHSVELKGISVPKCNNEPYVILSIDELNDNMLDATSNVNQAYAVVYYDNNQMTPGDVRPVKGTDFYLKNVEYKPPLRRLDRLSVSIRKHDGSLVSTADTGNNTNVSMLFEVISGTRST